MIERYFREHPRSVGETYFEHLRTASSFAGAMLIAALACFIHAVIPCLFEKTGSTAIQRLYERMVVHRRRVHSPAVRDTTPGRAAWT